MLLPYSEALNIESLSGVFEKKSESYKLFWFQVIINKVIAGDTVLTYQELIDEMVADAWYMVSEYRLNLGPSDSLEGLVHHVHRISGLKTCEKKTHILKFLSGCEDKVVAEMKRKLTYNVPYRLQSTFMEQLKKEEWNVSEKSLIEKINREKRLMYYFSELSGMNTKIYLQPEWCEYIVKNQVILKGWIQYNLIIYLQRRNPNVPGISSKLNPPMDRKLNKVIKYWKTIIEIEPVRDIYGNEVITSENISIDHFIPWSYVAHDEFWNLHPTTRQINSSKSNHLPEWSRYFPSLCELEFSSYQMVRKYDLVKAEFRRCREEHINSDDVFMRLYEPAMEKDVFCGNLEHILFPVYESARNAGFREWEFGG